MHILINWINSFLKVNHWISKNDIVREKMVIRNNLNNICKHWPKYRQVWENDIWSRSFSYFQVHLYLHVYIKSIYIIKDSLRSWIVIKFICAPNLHLDRILQENSDGRSLNRNKEFLVSNNEATSLPLKVL